MNTPGPGCTLTNVSLNFHNRIHVGDRILVKVKATGQATPVTVKDDADYDNNAVPVWSPAGDWILLGETLYSPDGKTTKSLGNHHSLGYVFSPDGKLVYGLRPAGDGDTLFTVDVASGAEKVIGKVGKENHPSSNLNPAMRFSLAPDGKSIAYGVGRFKDNLWMFEGFAAKNGWLARLGL